MSQTVFFRYVFCFFLLLSLSGCATKLAINTSPEPATIIIDGETVTTASSVEVDTEAGPHQVRIEHPDYPPRELAVVAIEGETTSVAVELGNKLAWLEVYATPAGSEITLDHRPAGPAPLRRQLAAGEYFLRAEKSGYRPQQKNIRLAPGATRKVEFALARREGTVQITSKPAGARIEIDRRRVGRAPVRQVLPAGEHAVTASLQDYYSETRKIDLQDRQDVDLVLALKPHPGTLIINTVPSGARISLNSRPAGTSPLVRRDLAPGPYSVEAVIQDGIARRRYGRVEVELPPGGDLAREIELTAEVLSRGHWIDKASLEKTLASLLSSIETALAAGDYAGSNHYYLTAVDIVPRSSELWEEVRGWSSRYEESIKNDIMRGELSKAERGLSSYGRVVEHMPEKKADFEELRAHFLSIKIARRLADKISGLLSMAEEARADGDVVAAVELYDQVLTYDEDNEAARQGVAAIVADTRQEVEASLSREDVASAELQLATLRRLEELVPERVGDLAAYAESIAQLKTIRERTERIDDLLEQAGAAAEAGEVVKAVEIYKEVLAVCRNRL